MKELIVAMNEWQRRLPESVHTHVETIRHAQEFLRKDWVTLSDDETDLILGRGEHGALGALGGAGRVTSTFVKSTALNLRNVTEIRQELEQLKRAKIDEALPNLVAKIHQVITNREGFGRASATRLMALTRPEIMISVSGESVEGLSTKSGISRSRLETSKGYGELIKWVMKQAWWQSPPPEESRAHELWRFRAAMIDVLVYSGLHFH